MKKNENQLITLVTKWMVLGVVMLGFGIVGVKTLTGSHAATTTPTLFVTPATGTYQPGAQFNVSIEVNWDQEYYKNVGVVFHLEGPITFKSGGSVARAGDYSCQAGFECSLYKGSVLGSQYPAGEMNISESIAGDSFPNTPTTTGTFLIVTLHLQATSSSGTGKVVVDPDYNYGYNSVYFYDPNSGNPYDYSSIEPSLQSGSYNIGNPVTPPTNPGPPTSPPSNPSPPASGGGGSSPVQGGGSGIQGSGGTSVQSPTTNAPIQNDTTPDDTQGSDSGFISSGSSSGNGGSNTGGSSDNTVIGSAVQKKGNQIGLYVSLVLFLGIAGGVGFWWWRRRSNGGDLAYNELPLPEIAPAPPSTPISSVYEEKINEAFYPATHNAQPLAPNIHTHADEPPDMFELARAHPETYGNDLDAASQPTTPQPEAPVMPAAIPTVEPTPQPAHPHPTVNKSKPVHHQRPTQAEKTGEDGTLIIHHES